MVPKLQNWIAQSTVICTTISAPYRPNWLRPDNLTVQGMEQLNGAVNDQKCTSRMSCMRA